MRRIVAAATALVLVALPTAPRARQLVGDTGPGTKYGIWVPDAWNGELVVYAHGWRDPHCPVAIPGTPEAVCGGSDSGSTVNLPAVREGLLERGYAFAASSYATTGFGVKDGTQRTLQLRELFAEQVGAPRRTYLWGISGAGATSMRIAERNPQAFDGALVMCGMVGGSPAELSYVSNARALFDVFFPGVVPGGLVRVPADLGFAEVQGRVLALFAGEQAMANFQRAAAWAAMDQVALAWDPADPTQLVRGILEILYFHVNGTPDAIALAGGIPFDNTQVVYSGPPWLAALGVDLALVNAAVERVAGDPNAMSYFQHYYDPRGLISFPVLTLHPTVDPAVPAWHEDLVRARVAATGSSEWLVQQSVAAFGHCAFTPAQELRALDALFAWVKTGAKPAGGDVTAP